VPGNRRTDYAVTYGDAEAGEWPAEAVDEAAAAGVVPAHGGPARGEPALTQQLPTVVQALREPA